MGITVLLPSLFERALKQFEETIDSKDYPNEELRKCVKDNIIPIIRKYGSYKLAIDFDLPKGLKGEDIQAISDGVEQGVKEYVFKLQKDIIHDLIALQMEICISRHT